MKAMEEKYVRITVRQSERGESFNPYSARFYGALRNKGIQIIDGLQVTDRYLKETRHQFDAIHLQWVEYFWPRKGRSVVSRLRRIMGLWKYLQTARRLNKKVLVTMHNVEPHEGFDWIDRIGYSVVAKNSDIVICHSKEAADVVIRRDRPRAEVIVMYHGNYDGAYPIARDAKIVRQELGLDADIPVVSCLGMLREYKGIDIAVAAARRLTGSVQLLVAGSPLDGFDTSGLERQLELIPGSRLISRWLSEQDFSDFVGASDLVLLPYRRISGSGALLAAWSLGRSVIASDLPFFCEMFEVAEGGGALFRAGDVDDLVETIQKHLARSSEERELAALHAANKFSWSRCVEPVVEAIQEWSCS